MKLILDSKELTDILTGTGASEEVKKKISDLLVSLASSPLMTENMEKIIEKQVEARVEERVNEALASALSVKRANWGGKTVVEGWAYNILSKKIEEETQGMSVHNLINRQMSEYTQSYVEDKSDSIMKIMMARAEKKVEETITEAYMEGVMKKVADDQFRQAVAQEVQTSLLKIIQNK